MRTFLALFVLMCTAFAAAGGILTSPGNTVIFPSVSWVFTLWKSWQPWLGWLLTTLFGVLGIWLLRRRDFAFTPMTARKLSRFRQIGRGHWSLRILLALVAIACLDQAIVGRRALAVKHDGTWYFPAFRQEIFPASAFGMEGEGETDYRKLKDHRAKSGRANEVILPLIPWDPTYDTDTGVPVEMVEKNGVLLDSGGKPYSGLAQQFENGDVNKRVRQARFRDGLKHLTEEGYDAAGLIVYSAVWDHGKLLKENKLPGFETITTRAAGPWAEMDYAPIAPNRARGHYLGTDSRGWDVAAQLFGGFQVVLKAAGLYLAATYLIGTTIGLLMGFWGGYFDLAMQRFIEILSSIPFIYLVIILVSILDKDNITLPLIIAVFCVFSWIGCSYYMRSATYREKARDYVAAARVLGAGPGRIVFKHILPNTISVLVTLIPFSITGISSSITSLDFIGFGLPERYASWGRLLADGVEHMRTSPWIVLSVFAILVSVLLLVTFVGEALREAFDPKKFTTYK